MPDQSTKDIARATLAKKYPTVESLDKVARQAAHFTYFGNHSDAEIGSLLSLTPSELAQTRERPFYKDELRRIGAAKRHHAQEYGRRER